MCDTVWNKTTQNETQLIGTCYYSDMINHRTEQNMSHPTPTAQTGSCFPLASCRCISLCRFPPAAQFCRLSLHRAQSAPPGSAWAAASAETQTWQADLGTGPAGAPQQTGASGDDRSVKKTDIQMLHRCIVLLCFPVSENKLGTFTPAT